MVKNKKIGWFILLGFVFGLIVGGISVHNVSALSNKTYEKLKVFTDCLEIVKKNYVEDVKTEDLITGAIEGMLSSLDPYSAYLDPDMYSELKVETKGSFGGLGIEIAIKDGILTVIAPIEDTPAYRAGIKAGDKIVKINEESTKGLNLMECVKRMRGPKGTRVTLTIFREGSTQTQEVSMVRDIIKIQSVKYKTLEKGYGYLRISQFQEKTAADATKALEALQKENPEGMKGLILDLRNDPGGLLDEAVEISDLFLDSGVIVSIKGRNEEEKTVFNAHHKEGNMPLWPMVVLVNQGSASASEIVAGALQDYGRAVIMGSKTFGKGSVQTIIPLDDGSGIKLTTARYYTPKGRSIHEKGIQPDIPLTPVEKVPQKMAEEQPGAADPDLDRALEQLKGMTIFQKYLDKDVK